MANTCFPIWVVISAYFFASFCLFFPHSTTAFHGSGPEEGGGGSVPVPFPAKHGTVVPKDQRWSVVSTESGEISTVKVSDGRDGFYHLQFITMEPNSLFLPVHLHSDMVFYVDSGSGTLSWVDLVKDSDKLRQVSLRTGDVYRLRTGSFFYFQSNLESERRKLRIYAIFSDSKEEIREGSSLGAYSSVADLVLGFDNKVLQAAFNVDEEVIQELKSGERQPMIVHGVSKVEAFLNVHYRIMRAFLGRMENDMIDVSKNKKKKDKAYNILEAKHDVENCNGWSLIVTSKQLGALKDSDFGIFLVNLTKGAMMGPHWNPLTAEIAVVLSGRGMVHVVCPSTLDEIECKNLRFRVKEGDVFVVPRYHPMAQISFNNESFVFMGFTTTQKKNHPQYLVGSASVFQVLDKRVLATSLGVSNTTMDEILSAQREAIILECTSCAEEEERLLEEEIQGKKEEEARKREEEERKKEEEEQAKRQEEEARREQEEARRREEEAAREQEAKRRQEEEEARRQEEEARREQEEAQRREEEEAREQEAKRRQDEEARRQEEEARREQEEARKREEEEAARQQEEEEAKRQEAAAKRQREESRRRQEEAARQQREQEEEATKRRQKEEEAARQQEEEDRRRQEEAERQHKEQEEEAARRRQQGEDVARQQEEEEEARRQHEEAIRPQREQEKEAARKRQQEEDMARQQEATQRQHEEAKARQQREQEEEVARRRRQKEAVARQLEKAARRQHEEEKARTQQEQEEDAVRHRQQEATTGQFEEEVKRRQEEATKIQQEEEGQVEGSRGHQEEEGSIRRQHEEETREQVEDIRQE